MATIVEELELHVTTDATRATAGLKAFEGQAKTTAATVERSYQRLRDASGRWTKALETDEQKRVRVMREALRDEVRIHQERERLIDEARRKRLADRGIGGPGGGGAAPSAGAGAVFAGNLRALLAFEGIRQGFAYGRRGIDLEREAAGGGRFLRSIATEQGFDVDAQFAQANAYGRRYSVRPGDAQRLQAQALLLLAQSGRPAGLSAGRLVGGLTDLAAARGIDRSRLPDMMTNLLVSDESLNRFGLANPAEVVEQRAKAQGVKSKDWSEERKNAEVLAALMEAAAKNAGAASRELDTTLGRLDRIAVKMSEIQRRAGELTARGVVGFGEPALNAVEQNPYLVGAGALATGVAVGQLTGTGMVGTMAVTAATVYLSGVVSGAAETTGGRQFLNAAGAPFGIRYDTRTREQAAYMPDGIYRLHREYVMRQEAARLRNAPGTIQTPTPSGYEPVSAETLEQRAKDAMALTESRRSREAQEYLRQNEAIKDSIISLRREAEGDNNPFKKLYITARDELAKYEKEHKEKFPELFADYRKLAGEKLTRDTTRMVESEIKGPLDAIRELQIGAAAAENPWVSTFEDARKETERFKESIKDLEKVAPETARRLYEAFEREQQKSIDIRIRKERDGLRALSAQRDQQFDAARGVQRGSGAAMDPVSVAFREFYGLDTSGNPTASTLSPAERARRLVAAVDANPGAIPNLSSAELQGLAMARQYVESGDNIAIGRGIVAANGQGSPILDPTAVTASAVTEIQKMYKAFVGPDEEKPHVQVLAGSMEKLAKEGLKLEAVARVILESVDGLIRASGATPDPTAKLSPGRVR